MLNYEKRFYHSNLNREEIQKASKLFHDNLLAEFSIERSLFRPERSLCFMKDGIIKNDGYYKGNPWTEVDYIEFKNNEIWIKKTGRQNHLFLGRNFMEKIDSKEVVKCLYAYKENGSIDKKIAIIDDKKTGKKTLVRTIARKAVNIIFTVCVTYVTVSIILYFFSKNSDRTNSYAGIQDEVKEINKYGRIKINDNLSRDSAIIIKRVMIVFYTSIYNGNPGGNIMNTDLSQEVKKYCGRKSYFNDIDSINFKVKNQSGQMILDVYKNLENC